MIRRAFLALRVIRFDGESRFNWAVKKTVKFGKKNVNISESVNSFCMGAIFPDTSGHKLSRNGFVVALYAF